MTLTSILTADDVANIDVLISLDELRSHEKPDIAFHVTPTLNIPSIIRNGLISQIGDRSRYAEYETGVYCFLDAESLFLHAHPKTGWLLRYSEIQPMNILAVDTAGLQRWDREPTTHWEFATRDSIAASRIKVIGRFC